MCKSFCSCFPVIKWVMEFLRKHFIALQQMNFSTGVYIMTLEKAKTMYKIKPCGRKNNYKEFPPEMMECLQLQSSIFCFNIYLITKGPFSNQKSHFKALYSRVLRIPLVGSSNFFQMQREKHAQERCLWSETYSSEYRLGDLSCWVEEFLRQDHLVDSWTKNQEVLTCKTYGSVSKYQSWTWVPAVPLAGYMI